MIAQLWLSSEIKLKAGVLDPDRSRSTRSRRCAPSSATALPLRIDPNCAWSVRRRRVGRELHARAVRGGYLEDPCAGIDGMAEVRRRCSPKATTRRWRATSPSTAFAICPRRCGRTACRSCCPIRTTGAACGNPAPLPPLRSRFGIGLSMHSNNHLGVQLMTMAHAAAACPHLTYACDTHYPWQPPTTRWWLGGRIPVRRRLRRDPRSSRGSASTSTTTAWRAAESATSKLPYRKRDDRSRNAPARRSRLEAHAAALVITHANDDSVRLAIAPAGVFGFPVTPFTDALAVDLAGLRANVADDDAHPFCAMSPPAAPASCIR